MATIGFIGLGNMGGPMARNLLKAGHQVKAFDPAPAALDAAVKAGAAKAANAGAAATGVELVVSMLPAGQHVRQVYGVAEGGGEGGVLGSAAPGTLLIDCSTIDVDSARAVAAAAKAKGLAMLDAPVSGGTVGAEAASLTFMVGGEDQAFARAEPILKCMGKTVVHAGAAGAGQAAKICNNMILGVSMIAVGEAFVLAEKLGLDRQKLFDIAAKSSGQCWSLTTYCPVPGPVPGSPANRDYRPGFTADMMLKDLRLAQQAANGTGASTPMGAAAAALYGLFAASGQGATDFSGIIKMIRGRS